MCKFCESIIDKSRNIEWYQRSVSTDDNFCRLFDDSCENCYDIMAEEL